MALDRSAIVRTGLRVLDQVGLEALTLRKIASELGVQPPALYWHFKSKQDLIDEMASTLLADHAQPIPEDTAWEQFALTFGEGMRQMLLRYRDGAKMFAGTHLTDTSVYRHQDAALRLLTGAGFSLEDAGQVFWTVYTYTIGYVIEEQAVYPRPGERDERYDIDHRTERMAHENVPLAAAAGPALFTDFDRRYTRGLQAIITGVATWRT
ncbi:TetR/AcrR family transcriptional regulator C-terminal domain-containing protein [Kibdelosporangium phytohabitans]|uniref:TetR/AcrR family transcriptional regulator C-terminal domain-containing protein n=1 Tax=Kibdelosporangium phytohabitans TaxID=860235 RepID=UPI000A4BD3E0|nr:TetR/AcrR family transcriptional regulator C-terminal domain-containing protein [Kibdelosporangium phytohabitans]MBE1461145.1 AcrR family transcriptional regulator [Kibdelosporangium phytohabitans]